MGLLLNQPLVLSESTRRHHELTDALHLLIAQVGVAQAVVQERCLLLAEGRGGQRHQDGALALPQVVTGGLAGHLGTTENAQLVVAQLEALTERQTEGPVAGKHRVLLADCTGPALQSPSLQGQGPTDREGVFARVLGGLETDHVERSLQGRSVIFGVEHLGVDVQVLPGQNLRTHTVKNGARRGTV